MELMEEVWKKKQQTEQIQQLEMWHKIEERHIRFLVEECKELQPNSDPKNVGKLRDMKQLINAVGQQIMMEREKLHKLEKNFLQESFKSNEEVPKQEKENPGK